MRRAATTCLVGFLVLLGASRARGQGFGKSGGEVRANTYTSGDQTDPATAVDVQGASMVVWRSVGQGDGTSNIYGQRFAQSKPVGAEFRVNTYTSGEQVSPQAAVGSGKYVVVWEEDAGEDGSGSGIYGQRFDASGPTGPEFRVNVYTTGNQTQPAVTADGAGNFVVAWSGAGAGDSDGIWARAFSSTGVPVGSDLRMNTYTTGVQANPSVAMPVGTGFSYVVVWDSVGQEGSGANVFAQRADILAGPLGSEFRVNEATTADQDHPAIATSGNATGHVVAWRKANGTTNSDIVGRFYNSSLTPVGAEFRVNSYSGRHERPSAAVDGANNFLVVWSDYNAEDGNSDGVFGRTFASGVPVGAEFHVNSQTTGSQTRARAANYRDGQFRVVWESQGQDGSGQGVYTQFYCKVFAGDANNDHVINVADVFFLINYLFAGGPTPIGFSDVNGDNAVDVADVFFLINYLFAGGPGPNCVV